MLNILLALHILAAVIFMGNIITAAFWKVRADRSGSLESIAGTSRAVLLADYIFTGPGIVGLLVTGILMVGITGWDRFQEMWLGISLALLILTGIIWAGALIPLQLRMVRLSREGLASGSLDPAYRRTSRLWSMFGDVATLSSAGYLVSDGPAAMRQASRYKPIFDVVYATSVVFRWFWYSDSLPHPNLPPSRGKGSIF